MLSFSLNLPSKAKPAGMLINGHITQNKGGYSEWKSKANAQLLKQKANYSDRPFPLKSGSIYGIILEHHTTTFKCGDVLNITGASMDTLVKSGIIKDDCPSIVNRVYCRMAKAKKDVILMVIAETKNEWAILMEKFMF